MDSWKASSCRKGLLEVAPEGKPGMIDLPPPLMTSEPGSFARTTIAERKPQILRQVIRDNAYPEPIVHALEAFRDELVRQPIQPLAEEAPDVDFWNRAAAGYKGRSWLDLPWYFAETYFYRRLLEAVRYFQPGPWHAHDPFGSLKGVEEEQAAAWLAGNGQQLAAAEADLTMLLHSSLWGNRADLSHVAMQEQVQSGLAAQRERQHILVDHTERVQALLAAGLERVDLVTDNAGRELLFDFALADYLLQRGWAGRVTFHLKGHPFFVSDAMVTDARRLAAAVAAEPLGRRLEEHLAAGRLALTDDPFWTTYLGYRHMPAPLAADLAGAGLVILKGDVNYRRLLDDRHWPHTARMAEIAAYFPAPFLTLRTLKAELMVDLEPGQAERLAAQDPEWLTNGRRGVVQLVAGRKG